MSGSPASSAARTASVPNPFVTATIVTACGVSFAIVALTWSRRSARASKLIADNLTPKEGPYDLGQLWARIQVVAPSQIGQCGGRITADCRRVTQLQEGHRKRRCDLLGCGIELEGVGGEQLAELENGVRQVPRASGIHHRSLDTANPLSHGVGAWRNLENQSLKDDVRVEAEPGTAARRHAERHCSLPQIGRDRVEDDLIGRAQDLSLLDRQGEWARLEHLILRGTKRLQRRDVGQSQRQRGTRGRHWGRETPIDRRRVGRIERAERERRELPQVPLEIREREIDERDVLAHAFNFLQVPDGEGVVVAVAEEHAVWLDRLQKVKGVRQDVTLI